MKIDDAIEQLQNAKKEGTKNIIFAWWKSQEFARRDNDAWGSDCDTIDDNMDWSNTHDRLYDMMEHD
jgi:hypothetical protein